jgi:hypothetical protein
VSAGLCESLSVNVSAAAVSWPAPSSIAFGGTVAMTGSSTFTPQSPDPLDSESPLAIVLGVVAGVLVVGAAVGIALYFRLRRPPFPEDYSGSSDLDDDADTMEEGLENSAPEGQHLEGFYRQFVEHGTF